MGRLDSNTLLRTALNDNDPFLYAHLVKFERPLVQTKEIANGRIRYETDATKYAYVTDAAYDITYNDGSTNLAGTANGAQVYRANKLSKVGSVSESSTIKISNMSIDLNAAAVGSSIESTFSIAQTLSAAIGQITITGASLKWVEGGFQEGDRIKFSSGNNSTKYFRIRAFLSSNTVEIDLLTLKDSSGNDLQITQELGFSSTISLESDEIVAILRDVKPTNFVNRSVFVYKAFLDSENPSILIGNPILLFKGIISNVSYKESDSKAIMTWGLKSHWGDFQQVRGRLTSDDFHRALKADPTSGKLVGNPEASIRPEYANDKGFAHSEMAVNMIGIYKDTELRYRMTKHGLLKRKTKMHEEEVEVEREVDLRFDLAAKYLPVVYGIRRLNGNLVFEDTSAGLNGAGEVFIAEALCEGPIHGIFNVYIEDASLICVDEPDSDVRAAVSPVPEDNAVDVFCVGRTDKGQVLDGSSVGGNSDLTYLLDNTSGLGWQEEPGTVERPFFDAAKFRRGGRKRSNEGSLSFSAGSTGVLHDDGFSIDAPTDIKVEFKAGKTDQEASSILMTQAHGDGFKIQKDFWGASLSGDYWSENHQLLDTAYTVTKNALTAEQTTVADLEYVVKGKIIDCYNYDGSYHHDRDPSNAYGTESTTHFLLGQTVDIKKSSDNSVLADDVVITELND